MHPAPADSQANTKRRSHLRWIGFISSGIYLLTLLFYFKGPQVHSRTSRELFAWFLVPSCLFLFWKGYKAVNDDAQQGSALKLVVGFGIVFCLLAVLIYPFH